MYRFLMSGKSSVLVDFYPKKGQNVRTHFYRKTKYVRMEILKKSNVSFCWSDAEVVHRFLKPNESFGSAFELPVRTWNSKRINDKNVFEKKNNEM